MAACAHCGTAYGPGDRRCAACGRSRDTVSRPSPPVRAAAGTEDPPVFETPAPASLRGVPAAPNPWQPLGEARPAFWQPEAPAPASPWARPAPPGEPAAPAGTAGTPVAGAVAAVRAGRLAPAALGDPPEAPATLADDGSLRVEIVAGHGDDGSVGGSSGPSGTGGDAEVVHVHAGPKRRWIVRAGLAAALASAVAAGSFVARDRPSPAFLVQTAGGTVEVTADERDAPAARWRHAIAAGTTLRAVAQDADVVYLALRDDATEEGPGALTVEALDAATGTHRWAYDVIGNDLLVHATPFGALVNVQDGRGVYASMLDRSDGAVSWQLDGLVTQAPGESGVGIVQEVGGRPSLALAALDLRTGSELWRPSGSLRTGLGLGVVVDANCDEIQGREAATGLVQWRFPALDGSTFCTRGRPQITVAGDHVVVADGTDVVGLDGRGQERWRQPLDGATLAGANATWVWLRDHDEPAGQTFLDAGTGVALDEAAVDLVRSASRDTTVLAQRAEGPLVLLDATDGLVRVDAATAQPRGASMRGVGPAGLGRTTVYRVDEAGAALVGYDLTTGRQRWSVALAAPAGDAGDVDDLGVWSAGDVVIVGGTTGMLTAFG